MQKVYIIYRTFFDLKGEKYTIGGIQTYIRHLINVLQQIKLVPVIVQFADCNFNKKYKDINVYGVDVRGESNERSKVKILLDFIKKKFNDKDLLLFATEDLYIPTFTERILAIQHGITWDKPRPNSKFMTLEFLRKTITNYRRLIRTRKLKNIVCVDYNYINWLRTQVFSVNKKIFAIPNSTKIKKNKIVKDDDKIRIIFARRFEIYRGTRLFSKVIKALINKYDNVYVTFAGTGSDELFLKTKFEGNPKVEFITYKSEESLDIHCKYHIAVVPTLGSEGTSLSLLEAMASKCAVVATNVGGMTNIILDNYNGLLINPNEHELREALEKLIMDEDFRKHLSNNAFITVSEAFNHDLWEKRWIKVLNEVIDSN